MFLCDVPFTQYKLMLWLGYVTNIRQHDQKMLLCCEIGNRTRTNTTGLNQMAEIVMRGGANASSFAMLEQD